jgi:uncharacterized protein
MHGDNAASLDMVFGVAPADIALLVVAVIGGGLITGTLAALFGIGGGAVIVPVLYEIFRLFGVPEEVRMQLCVGTSLAIIVPTSIRSFLAHRAYEDIPIEILRTWTAPIMAGIAVGAVMAAASPTWVFKLAFVTVTAAISLRMLIGSKSHVSESALPGFPTMALYGFVIGLYSSLIGVGGGSVSTVILIRYGRSIHVAVGVSAGVGVIISIAGTLGYALAGLPQQSLLPAFSIGFVSLLGVLVMAPITSATAPFGARLAHKLPKRRLEIGLGVYLLAVALRFVLSLTW